MDNLDKVIDIDQSPIERASLQSGHLHRGDDAHSANYWPVCPNRGRVATSRAASASYQGGRCGNHRGRRRHRDCRTLLPDIYVTCERCRGKRYNEETLDIRYKGKNIAEILAMTVEESLAFFENVPPIRNRLQTIVDVGLGYLHPWSRAR